MGQLFPSNRWPGVLGVAPPEDHVELETNHPLAEGLLFYSIGLRDMVSGTLGHPITDYGPASSGRNYGPHGFELENHTSGAKGFEWENLTEFSRVDGTKFLTVIASASKDDNQAQSRLVGFPRSRTSMDGADTLFSIGTGSDGKVCQVRWSEPDGPTVIAVTTTAEMNPADGTPYVMGATKNDTTDMAFYKNGVFLENRNHAQNSDFIDFPAQYNLFSFTPNTQNLWGWNGRLQYQAWWLRALSAGAHARFVANPSALLRLRVPTLYYFIEGGGQTVTVGQASTTDTAFGVVPLRTYATGQAVETDSAFAATPERTHPIGLVSSADTAFAVVHSRALQLAQASEADSAFAAQPLRTRAIGLASETDSALSVTSARARSIGLASEVDSAFATQPLRAYDIGQASEADTAFAVAVGAGIAIGQAIEIDSAFVIAHAKAVLLGLGIEADTAFALTIERLLSTGLAIEADSAFAMIHARALATGQATEADTALAVAHARAYALGLALETDIAFVVTPQLASSVAFHQNEKRTFIVRRSAGVQVTRSATMIVRR